MNVPKVVFSAFLLLSSCVAMAQGLTDFASTVIRWDSTHGVAFPDVGEVINRGSVPLLSYTRQNVQRGAAIDFFKDFDGLDHVITIDAAAGPDNSSIYAVVLSYGGRQIRHVILTYSSTGELKQILDTEPYFPDAIAVDDSGTIYALGNRTDHRKGDLTDYPLLSVYSPDGRLLRQGLNSKLLGKGALSIGSGDDYSRAVLTVSGDRLVFYAPTSREIVTCTPDGQLLSKVSITPLLQRVANEDRVARVAVENISLNKRYAVLTLNEVPASTSDGAIFTIRVLDLSNSNSAVLHKASGRKWHLLGLYHDDYLLLERGAPNVVLRTIPLIFPK